MSATPEAPFDARRLEGYGEVEPIDLPDPRDLLFDRLLSAKYKLLTMGVQLTESNPIGMDVTNLPEWRAAEAELLEAEAALKSFQGIQ